MTSSNEHRPEHGTSQSDTQADSDTLSRTSLTSNSNEEQAAARTRMAFPDYTVPVIRDALTNALGRGGAVLSFPLRARQFWADFLESIIGVAMAACSPSVEYENEGICSWVILPGNETTPTTGGAGRGTRTTSAEQAAAQSTDVDENGARPPPDISFGTRGWQIVDARAHIPNEGSLNGDGVYRRRVAPGMTVNYARDRARYGARGLGNAVEGLGRWAATRLLGEDGSEQREEYVLDHMSGNTVDRLQGRENRASQEVEVYSEVDSDSEDDDDAK